MFYSCVVCVYHWCDVCFHWCDGVCFIDEMVCVLLLCDGVCFIGVMVCVLLM